jgi:hypothetical protein
MLAKLVPAAVFNAGIDVNEVQPLNMLAKSLIEQAPTHSNWRNIRNPTFDVLSEKPEMYGAPTLTSNTPVEWATVGVECRKFKLTVFKF